MNHINNNEATQMTSCQTSFSYLNIDSYSSTN